MSILRWLSVLLPLLASGCRTSSSAPLAVATPNSHQIVAPSRVLVSPPNKATASRRVSGIQGKIVFSATAAIMDFHSNQIFPPAPNPLDVHHEPLLPSLADRPFSTPVPRLPEGETPTYGPVPGALSDGDPAPDVFVLIFRGNGRKKKRVTRIRTDQNGQFLIRLAPGQYSVMAQPREENNGYHNKEVQVRVVAGHFSFVTTNFDCGY